MALNVLFNVLFPQVVRRHRHGQAGHPGASKPVAGRGVGVGAAERVADELEFVEALERVFEAVAEVQDVEGEEQDRRKLEDGGWRIEVGGSSDSFSREAQPSAASVGFRRSPVAPHASCISDLRA